jgi:hypothetical protein
VSPWKVILATMVIFCCGVVTGVLVMKTAIGPPFMPRAGNPRPPGRGGIGPAQLQSFELLRRMDTQLTLSTNQHNDIAKIMRDSQERTRPLWDQIAPKMQQEENRLRAEISQVLTPPQLTNFESMLQTRPRPGTRERDPNRPPGLHRTNGFPHSPSNEPPAVVPPTNGP